MSNPITRPNRSVPVRLLATLLGVATCCSTPLFAADVFKADNLDNLNLETSWDAVLVPPGASDVAVWDNRVATAVPQNLLLGADASWSGLRILDPASPVAINAGNTLTLGAAGIDTSGAFQSLTLANAVTIGAPQDWNLTTAVTVSGVISGVAGNGITLTGLGQLNVSGANNAFVDGITVNSGIVNVTAGSSMPINLNGGQFTVGAALGNPVHVVSSGIVRATGNRTLSGAITGAGTITAYVTSSGTLLTLNGDLSGFSGTIEHGPFSTGSLRANSSTFVGNSNVIWDLGPSGGFSRNNSAATIYFGALQGGAGSRLDGNNSINYEIGHLNLDTVFSGALNSCRIVKVGTGTLTLDGASGYAGGTTISNGVVQIGNFGNTGAAGTGGITNYSALVFNRFDDFTFPNTISGTGSLTNAGSGKVTLTGANTYSGATVVAAGGLIFGSSAAVSGNITVADAATLGAVVTAAGATATEGNVSFGFGGTYEFDLGTFGNPTAAIVSNSGTVTLNGDVTVNVLGDAPSLSVGTFTLLEYGARSGPGNFVQGTLPVDVTGTVNDDTANNRVTLTITSVSFVDPTLRYVGDSAGIWDSDNLANQIWQVVGTGQTTNFYFGASALLNDAATGTTAIDINTFVYPETVTVSNVAKTYTFGGMGTISGLATLTKQGSGTLVITNANDYTGVTSIESGTVLVSGETGSIGSGGVTNNSALIFDRTSATNFLPNTAILSGQFTGAGNITILGVDSTNSIVQVDVGVPEGNPYSGGTTISNALVRLNANPVNDATRSAAKSTGMGTGAITFLGDAVLELEDWGVGNNSAQFGNFAAPLHVSAGQAGTLRAAGRMTVSSTLTGEGTFNLGVSFVRCVISGDFSAFTGQLNVFPAAAGNQYQIANAAGLPFARLHLGGGVTMGGNAPLPNNSIVSIGELSGEEGTFIATVGETPRAAIFSVGGLNTSSTFAGSIQAHSLTKMGTGTLTLSGVNNTYTGATTINNGVLALVENSLGGNTEIANTASLTIAAPGILDVSGQTDGTFALGAGGAAQTLRGDGAIHGSLNVGALGTVTPGFSIGTLTVTNQVTLGGTAVFELDRSLFPNSDRLAAPTIIAGGTLTVTNIGPALQADDSFQLFSTPVSGSFATLNLPPTDPVNNMTYTWENRLAVDGTIRVLTATPAVNTTPSDITLAVSGGVMELQWPADRTGWTLQTNAVSVANAAAWFEFPAGSGSRDTNRVFITIDPNQPQVFYRLVYP
jgi:fibronectin-binding autotransporter adhesin